MYWIVLRTDRNLMLEAKARQEKQKENEWAWFEEEDNLDSRKTVYEKGAVAFGVVPTAKPNFTYKLKIILGFFQITVNMAFALDIPWPSYYHQFITNFGLLNFDFIQWSSVACVVSANFYSKFITICLIPIGILIVVFILYWIPRYVRNLRQNEDYDLRRAADQRSTRQFWKLFLFTLFLIYPGVSSICLRLFVCRRINGADYLLADFTKNCYDAEWRQYAYIDIFFIALYPVGIPVFFFILLWTNRKRLSLPDIRVQLGFLYEAYSADFWWFELVDMMNKLFLTSFLAFFPPETQLPIGFAWCLMYVDVLLLARPYVRKGDDRLHLFAQTIIGIILLAGT